MYATVALAPSGVIVVQARLEGPSGIGDMGFEVEPGQTGVGIPYEVWRKYAGKCVDLDDVRRAAEAAAAHR